jgi:hypothetical protein
VENNPVVVVAGGRRNRLWSIFFRLEGDIGVTLDSVGWSINWRVWSCQIKSESFRETSTSTYPFLGEIPFTMRQK